MVFDLLRQGYLYEDVRHYFSYFLVVEQLDYLPLFFNRDVFGIVDQRPDLFFEDFFVLLEVFIVDQLKQIVFVYLFGPRLYHVLGAHLYVVVVYHSYLRLRTLPLFYSECSQL